jgi:hypothetical protein
MAVVTRIRSVKIAAHAGAVDSCGRPLVVIRHSQCSASIGAMFDARRAGT